MYLQIRDIISRYDNLIDNTDLIIESSKEQVPILLGIGESWSQTPQTLVNFLSKAPPYVHGYTNSLSGLSSFRDKLYEYIIHTQRIDKNLLGLFDVFVTPRGTKSVMYDFGKLINSYHTNIEKILITTNPGWYYEYIFSPQNFHMKYIALNPSNNFLPKLEDFKNAFHEIGLGKDVIKLVILNAQHNPTGNNWDPRFLREVINISLDNDAYILLDDAYYMIKDPDIESSSSLKILLKEIYKRNDKKLNKKWLCVRSLGKQFYCNGWGIGAIVGAIETLNALMEVAEQHAAPSGGVLQYAMSEWLNIDDSYQFIIDMNQRYKVLKEFIKTTFTKNFGYPAHAIHVGTCTTYILISIPPSYSEKHILPREFIRALFKNTGVLFAELFPNKQAINYVRIYIGVQPQLIEEALRRLKSFNFHYNMSPMI